MSTEIMKADGYGKIEIVNHTEQNEVPVVHHNGLANERRGYVSEEQ